MFYEPKWSSARRPCWAAIVLFRVRKNFRSAATTIGQRQHSTSVFFGCHLDYTYLFIPEEKKNLTVRLVKKNFHDLQPASGLELRDNKIWIFTPEEFRHSGANLLGTHIGPTTATFLAEKLTLFTTKLRKLNNLPAQDCLLILRRCLLLSLNHYMRRLEVESSACKEADQLIEGQLLQFFQQYLEVTLKIDVLTLPIRLGGLGLLLLPIVGSLAYKASTATFLTSWSVRQITWFYLNTLDETYHNEIWSASSGKKSKLH